MIKVNKAKIRRDIALDLADKFIDSGVPYTCTAVIYSHLNDDATNKARELYNSGIVFSKSSYSINVLSCTAGMFLRDAAIIVHEHFYPSK